MTKANIKTTSLELTEALQNYVDGKLGQLERHLGAEPTNIDVELQRHTSHQSGPIFRCEINITMPHDKHVLRAETNEDDMYAAIDLCIPKIKEQLEKESEKRETMVRKGGRELKEMIQEENAE